MTDPIAQLRVEVANSRETDDIYVEVLTNHLASALAEIDRLVAGTDPLQCVNCYLEVHAGIRDTANPAILVVGGNSTCAEHVVIQQGPSPQQFPDRTSGGIIIPGTQINGGH